MSAFQTVHTNKEFIQALSQAEAGSVIILAEGTYTDAGILEVNASGTCEEPVIIRSRICHKAVLTGQSGLRILGDHVIVSGLTFEKYSGESGSAIEIHGCSVRVTECIFADGSNQDGIVIKNTAASARVDHCLFRNVDKFLVQIQVSKDSVPVNCRIDHNLFVDQKNGQGANGREVVQVGQSYMEAGNARPAAVIEYNKVFRCAGDQSEIISIKSSGNVIRRNVFVDCERGFLSLRHGTDTTVEENILLRCDGGIGLADHGHTIRNNVIMECGYGVAFQWGAGSKSYTSSRCAAHNSLVANNTIVSCGVGIDLLNLRGKKEWQDRQKTIRVKAQVPPAGNRILDNVIVGPPSPLLLWKDAPDNTLKGNVFYGGDMPASETHTWTIQDPGFADQQNLNFTPTSPTLDHSPGATINWIQGKASILEEAIWVGEDDDGWVLAHEDSFTQELDKRWWQDAGGFIETSPDGMTFQAADTHDVLWFQPIIEGDVKFTVRVTNLSPKRAATIFFIQAQGIGSDEFPRDIYAWRKTRADGVYQDYFSRMDYASVSFTNPQNEIRFRQNSGFQMIKGYEQTNLFAPGIPYDCTVEKVGFEVMFTAKNLNTGETRSFRALLNPHPKINSGRLGIRHMSGRKVRYRDFRVYTRKPEAS